jgi:hypothetical protein
MRQCPVVFEDCDDPGCPGPFRCVLTDPEKLLRWIRRNPKHPLAGKVLMEAFDPCI